MECSIKIKYYKVLNLILIVLSAWLASKYFDTELKIEAGVINELAIAEDREFLIKLPELLKRAGSRDALFTLLNENYPNVLIEKSEQDICWGRLRLKFSTPSELSEITEECLN